MYFYFVLAGHPDGGSPWRAVHPLEGAPRPPPDPVRPRPLRQAVMQGHSQPNVPGEGRRISYYMYMHTNYQ